MSDFRAIGGVSATLRTLLEDRMEIPAEINNFLVTVGTPRPESQDAQPLERSRINLFLYRATENSSLKNREIPGQGQGLAFGHPPLSLNLYYMLTPYGSTADEDFTDETLAHYLLGSAMRVLHDFPVITEELLTVRPPPNQIILDASLRDQHERVKITLEPTSLDDLSKVWTGLTLPLRLSATYMVSVVQIESRRPRRIPKPVGEPPLAGPRIFPVTFRSPQIQEIRVSRPDDQPEVERRFAYARIGDVLILLGRNLTGETTRIIVGAVDVTEHIEVLLDNRIEVTIPDDELLQPGPQPVKVVQELLMGDPPTPHLGFQSNLAVFMLVPSVFELIPDLNASPKTLRITGNGLFNSKFESLTIVGDKVIRGNPVPPDIASEYTMAGPTEIAFNLPDLVAGAYAVRVRVNGADSIEERVLVIP